MIAPETSSCHVMRVARAAADGAGLARVSASRQVAPVSSGSGANCMPNGVSIRGIWTRPLGISLSLP
jgi:hypothetical protein